MRKHIWWHGFCHLTLLNFMRDCSLFLLVPMLAFGLARGLYFLFFFKSHRLFWSHHVLSWFFIIIGGYHTILLLMLIIILRDSLDTIAASVLSYLKPILHHVLDRSNLLIDLFFHILSVECQGGDLLIIHSELRFHHFH